MSNSSETERDQQTEKRPAEPAPRGGGDISGKGVSGAEGTDEDSATTSTNEPGGTKPSSSDRN